MRRAKARSLAAMKLKITLSIATILAATACKKEASVEPAVATKKPPMVQDPINLFTEREESSTAPRSGLPVIPFKNFSEGLPTTGTWRGYPLLQDFNGDGRADLVAANREEDGYSAWEAPISGAWQLRNEGLSRDMGYGPARAADVDSDGDIDLIVSAHTDAIRVFLNDGHMHWTRSEVPIENTVLLLDIAVGKINDDLFPDIFGVGHFKGGLSILTGDGRGKFDRRLEEKSLMSSTVMGRCVELGDLDGDGRDDLFAGTNEGAKAFLSRGDGTLRWEDISTGLPVPKIGNTVYGLAVRRFTSAAHPQLAVCAVADPGDAVGQRNTIGVYEWQPETHAWKQIDRGLNRDDSYHDLKAADFNSDGKMDLITWSTEAGVCVHLGDGEGGFRLQGALPDARRGRIALGDINADGLVDIAVSWSANKESPTGGGIAAYLNDASLWTP